MRGPCRVWLPCTTPEIWRRMFDEIPSGSFGLNYDPSHLVWQHMDYIKPLREFADRIFHVHAKDVRIDREGLDDEGQIGHDDEAARDLDVVDRVEGHDVVESPVLDGAFEIPATDADVPIGCDRDVLVVREEERALVPVGTGMGCDRDHGLDGRGQGDQPLRVRADRSQELERLRVDLDRPPHVVAEEESSADRLHVRVGEVREAEGRDFLHAASPEETGLRVAQLRHRRIDASEVDADPSRRVGAAAHAAEQPLPGEPVPAGLRAVGTDIEEPAVDVLRPVAFDRQIEVPLVRPTKEVARQRRHAAASASPSATSRSPPRAPPRRGPP